jgi:single-strand DNA-binding protein
MQKVIIIGRLGANPEVKYLQDGTAVANFTVATSERWKSKTGEKQERTEWHKLVVFGRLAEVCSEYLKKGSLAYFEGKLQTRSWEGNDGIKRYVTEIKVSEMEMLGSRQESRQDVNRDEPDLDQIPF